MSMHRKLFNAIFQGKPMAEEKTEKPNWLKVKPSDMEKIVIDLAKQGKSSSEIGMILRDQHGIPKSKLLGKKISKIVKEANINLNDEKELIGQKIKGLNAHLDKNKHDKKAKRSLMKSSWIVHKLEQIK